MHRLLHGSQPAAWPLGILGDFVAKLGIVSVLSDAPSAA